MSERSVEHATIVIERRYPASPERTFAAWADVEAKARWLGASEGELELDFRVGGWSATGGRCRTAASTPTRRSTKTSSGPGGSSTPTRCSWTTDGSPSPWPRLSSRRSTTAPASSSPSRAPSSTATRCPPAATRAWAACWTRWARSCRASKPPLERPTDSHVGATDLRLAQRSRPSARPSFSAGLGPLARADRERPASQPKARTAAVAGRLRSRRGRQELEDRLRRDLHEGRIDRLEQGTQFCFCARASATPQPPQVLALDELRARGLVLL
jgi:hypothetical protein